MYRLRTLAESTQRLSASFNEAHLELPWDDIAGFRYRAVHGYPTIDLDLVWNLVGRPCPVSAVPCRLSIPSCRTV